MAKFSPLFLSFLEEKNKQKFNQTKIPTTQKTKNSLKTLSLSLSLSLFLPGTFDR
jgi:hypothetical protein